MRKLIVALMILIGTTACENHSGAEISYAGESGMSTSPFVSTEESGPNNSGPAIDYNPRTARTFADADAVCTNAGRALCSNDQYADGYAHGDIDYTVAQPGNYWMKPTTSPDRNLFQATSNFTTTMLVTPTLTRKFYCCAL